MAAISASDAGFRPQRRRLPAEAGLVALAAALILWPALANGFPLIFSDTGTYISQAMKLQLGWDRPPFYSFLVLASGWGRTLWPVVIGQCVLAAVMVRAMQRTLAPEMDRVGALLLLAVLAAASSLGWTAAQVMPDIFSPLMVLGFAQLLIARRRAMMWLPMVVVGLAIMVHLSNLPVYAGLCLSVLPLRALRARVRWAALLVPFLIGVAGLTAVNVVARGRFSPSPYGATFVLARLVENGPARVTLARDCAAAHWALCAYRDELPATADAFLWHADSPLYRAGGPIRLVGQTDAIVWRTVISQPRAVAWAALADLGRQLVTFAPGSGLRPWHATAWRTIRQDMPGATFAAFRDGRQARGRMRVPGPIALLDEAMAVAGMVLTAGFAGGALVFSRRLGHGGAELGLFCRIVLLALAGNAAVTGALSGPHDRYQCRIVWLATFSGLLVARRLHAVWRSRPIRSTT